MKFAKVRVCATLQAGETPLTLRPTPDRLMISAALALVCGSRRSLR
jgi:hypothetical protein